MARVRNIENLNISTQNVIPSLAETPLDNVAMMLAAGGPAIPTSEYIVSGTTITWDDVTAGYNLEVGETVVVDYEYENGVSEGGPPAYDPTSSTQNPVDVAYNLTVITQDTVPSLIHIPVVNSLVVKVNDVIQTENVDWTLSGKIITWISGTTLVVGDIVNVAYRVPA